MAERQDTRRLEKLYLEIAHQPVLDFYASLESSSHSSGGGGQPGGARGNLVGLLTYPNSGTSWFLQLAQTASGLRNHTVYAREAEKTGGGASRGVYMLNSPRERSPEAHEPSLVKSHVAYYGEEDVRGIAAWNFARHAQRWRRDLPAGCYCHIRLVRHPFDNLRARYHLHVKLGLEKKEGKAPDFSAFFRQDLRRYLLWHACCNRLAEDVPLLSVFYADLLDRKKSRDAFYRAMRFAAYPVTKESVARAYEIFPPIYAVNGGLPVHLSHYTEEDIYWMADELRKWRRTYAWMQVWQKFSFARRRRASVAMQQ